MNNKHKYAKTQSRNNSLKIEQDLWRWISVILCILLKMKNYFFIILKNFPLFFNSFIQIKTLLCKLLQFIENMKVL